MSSFIFMKITWVSILENFILETPGTVSSVAYKKNMV